MAKMKIIGNRLTDREILRVLNERLLAHLMEREFKARKSVPESHCRKLRALDVVVIKWMDAPDTEHLVMYPPAKRDKCFSVITATNRLKPTLETVNFDQVVSITRMH